MAPACAGKSAMMDGMTKGDSPAREVLRGSRTWTIGEELARGGTAVVLAVTADDGTVGVCKRPSDHRFAVSAAMRARYQRELGLLAQVNHPHVLKLLDLVDVQGERVGIFEKAERSIYQLLPSDGRPATADALRWLAEASQGLAALDASRIVHRDITPKNLLVMSDGRLCISDLGAARAIDEDTVTLLGEHLGSLIYTSERQARDPHRADFSDDVFSLGQVAYQLFTGRRPIGNPPPVKIARPDLPQELADVIDQLRHSDPRGRPRDGDELVNLAGLQIRRTTNVALGLAEARLFDEAADVVQRLIRLDDKPPTGAEAAELIWQEQMVNVRDTPMDLRLSRWRYKRFPNRGAEHWLARAQREWESEVVGEADPAVRLTMLPTTESMHSVRDDLEFMIASFHRTALWMQAATEPDVVSRPRGLSNLGRHRPRSALIVGEALLSLAAAQAGRHAELVSLLPSSWLPDFDNLDEALLSICLSASEDEDQAWSDALWKYRDGRRLQRLWEAWMATACRCHLTGSEQTEHGEQPLSEPDDECPFLQLAAAVDQFYDPQVWIELWVTHPTLATVEFFADAAPTALRSLAAASGDASFDMW